MSTQKALRIETAPNSALLQIVWEGGGQIPSELEGMFTSTVEANRAIALWESTHREVEVVDATKATAEEALLKQSAGRASKSS